MDSVLWVAVLAVVVVVSTVSTASFLAFHLRRFVGYHRHKGLEVPRLTPRALLLELRAFLALGWWAARAYLADGLRVPRAVRGRPVVAIHGYSQNASNMWGIRKALEARGRPTVGISMVHRVARLERYVDQVECRLDRVRAELGDSFDVVAHSMGGIVLRMLLVRRPDLAPRIRRVVTLGSPHQGTASVRGFGWLALPELRAMHRRSELLAGLPELTALLPEAEVIAVAGTSDTVVYPVSSALAPGARSVVLPDVGHAGLLAAPPAIDAVCDALDAGEPAAA